MAGGNGNGELTGSIVRIVKDDAGRLKGFGFLRGTDGKEYFFHRSHLAGVRLEELGEGQEIRFLPAPPADGQKGPRTERVWIRD